VSKREKGMDKMT